PLPQSYLTFQVTHDAPEVVDPPVMDNGFITFGSLVTLYKMTVPTLDAWADILLAVDDSRLLLGNADLDSETTRDYVRARFDDRGVNASRLIFRGKAEHRQFLSYYNEIDIALDAFPYNGGTTTMEAIWQGVPVITFLGDRWASRTSASLLQGTHLQSFVADDRDGYVAQAVEQANQTNAPERLRDLRHQMRIELADSQVCDATAFAAAMEQTYRRMISEGGVGD
ncbi:MAG: hypothetical protein AAGA03_17575, partial [Planctomycetota bacterium]